MWTASIAPQAVTRDLTELLSTEERDTAGRFHFDRHRQAYVFAHAVLRDILGRYLNRPARKVRFEVNPYGKPFLVDADARIPPFFNLSHSGALVLVAITSDRQIGVDVERVRPLEDIESMARGHLSPQECAFVLRHDSKERERAFFQCWTRKESYAKALGRGLSIPLNSFDTFMLAGNSGLLLARATEAPSVESWWLTDLEVPAGYVGALTVERGVDRIMFSQWLSLASAQ